MIPEDVTPILTSLLERSRRKEVEWLPVRSYSTENEFSVVFPTSSLAVWEDASQNTFGGRIMNDRGDVVISFEAEYNTGEHALLRELVDLARRKVLRADETLAEIHRAITTGERVGKLPPSKADDEEDVPF